MTSYILSVVGIVFLGVLIDVIMPDGEMNKYVKGVFSIIALCVILSPIPKLFKNDFDIEKMFYDSAAVQIDTDFIEATNKQLKTQFENILVAKLKDAGFDKVEVEILCDVSNYNFKIKKVIVDISKIVINTNLPHINKYTEIKDIATKYLNVEESDIVINE
jgi:stage III sporulation protein AF